MLKISDKKRHASPGMTSKLLTLLAHPKKKHAESFNTTSRYRSYSGNNSSAEIAQEAIAISIYGTVNLSTFTGL